MLWNNDLLYRLSTDNRFMHQQSSNPVAYEYPIILSSTHLYYQKNKRKISTCSTPSSEKSCGNYHQKVSVNLQSTPLKMTMNWMKVDNFKLFAFLLLVVVSESFNLQMKSGSHAQNFKFLPLLRGTKTVHFPRIVRIAGVYPDLSPEDLLEPLSNPAADAGMWSYDFPDAEGNYYKNMITHVNRCAYLYRIYV